MVAIPVGSNTTGKTANRSSSHNIGSMCALVSRSAGSAPWCFSTNLVANIRRARRGIRLWLAAGVGEADLHFLPGTGSPTRVQLFFLTDPFHEMHFLVCVQGLRALPTVSERSGRTARRANPLPNNSRQRDGDAPFQSI